MLSVLPQQPDLLGDRVNVVRKTLNIAIQLAFSSNVARFSVP